MHTDATGTNTVTTTVEARKPLGAGLAVSLLATLLFAVVTVPLLDGGAPWGYVAGAVVLSLAAGIVATVDAALILERRPAGKASHAGTTPPFDVAA